MRSLDWNSVPPPGQLCRWITGTRITAQCRLYVRLQFLWLHLNLDSVWGKVHAQGDGLEERDLSGRVVRLTAIPCLVVSYIGEDCEL